MVVKFVPLIVGAYLLGSIPTAYLVAKWSRGIDLRQYGSGNVGATNLLLATSKRLGIPVILFDLAKGALMVWVAQIVGLETYLQLIVGLAAVIGHNWPVFLRFSGGRGILTALGVAIIIAPKLTLVLLIMAFLWIPFRQFPLGTLFSLALLPVCSWFSSAPVIKWLFGQTLGINERLPVTLGFIALLLIVVIRRLTAPRSSLSASVTTGQLLVNRLLFDRDIRDREAWIRRRPIKTTSSEKTQQQEKG